MVYTFKHNGKDFVVVKTSRNSPLLFTMQKSKVRKNWIILDSLPSDRKIGINKKTNYPYVGKRWTIIQKIYIHQLIRE